MSEVREKFRKLTRVFDPIYQPGASKDGAPSAYVAGLHAEFREQLEAALDLNDAAKLLIAGQPGCGKTTLLLSLAAQMRTSGRAVAFVDLEALTAVSDLDPVEMYLAALAELAQEAAEGFSEATGTACRSCVEKLLGAEPGEDYVAALRRLLSLVRDDQALRDQMRQQMRAGTQDDPFVLLCSALRDLDEAGCRPVVILDGLDKLPPGRAAQTFLDDKRKPMAQTPGAAILTIPLSVVYEPTFNVLSGRYNNADSAVLPAVRLWEFEPKKRELRRSERGIAALRQVVAARVDPIDSSVVLDDAIDRAIEGSAGNVRELARLVQASVVKAHVRGGDFIERQDVEAAIADQRESFRRSFEPRFLPLLQRVRDDARLDDSSEVAKQLLYGLWVMEYRNGEIWYALPEPVRQLLQQLERQAQ